MSLASAMNTKSDPIGAEEVPSEIQPWVPQFVIVETDELGRRVWAKHRPVGTRLLWAIVNKCLATAELFLCKESGDKGEGQVPGQPFVPTSPHRRRGISTQATEKARRLHSAIGLSICGTMAILFRVVFTGLIFSLYPSFICFGETIDRIVAVVNNQIITLSDLEVEERFYQLDRPHRASTNDHSAEEKAMQRELIEQMIEKLLMSEQIVGFPGSKISQEEVETQLNALQEKWGGKDPLDQVLIESHTTREELKEHLRWQILVLKYVDNRFRQFAAIDSAEIATYYQKTLIPEMERKGIRQPPPQPEVEAKIREILTEERVNQAIEEWLASLKETANIHIFE